MYLSRINHLYIYISVDNVRLIYVSFLVESASKLCKTYFVLFVLFSSLFPITFVCNLLKALNSDEKK